jgi:hypothetical protein
MFYQNDLAMRNTADVTGRKPIAVWLQSISGGDAVNLNALTAVTSLGVKLFYVLNTTMNIKDILNTQRK